MNNWNGENYGVGMPVNPMMHVPPLLPPMCMMQDPVLNSQNVPQVAAQQQAPLMGTRRSRDQNEPSSNSIEMEGNMEVSVQNQGRSHDRSGHRRDRDRGRADRADGRSRSRERYDRDRSDRNRNRRHDRGVPSKKDKKSKWSDNNDSMEPEIQQQMAMSNMMVPPNMMSYSGMMPNTIMGNNMMGNNMMMQQQMDPNPMQTMIPSMNMMNNMMPNMMDQNMMMMNPQMMMMGNQQIYLSNGVLLPPIPGTQTPSRRDKPKGCRTIFVGGLPPSVTTETLNELFQRFGVIQDIKSPKSGVFYVRFRAAENIEQAFFLSGYRFKYHDQSENEATTMFIDYAINREDQSEYERKQRMREPTPPRVEQFTQAALATLSDKIKSEEEFANVAPTLAAWLERGECNKKNANSFYSLIQVSNNQIRRLFNEKMQLDDEYQNMKTTFRDKFARVLLQFEQVAKILSAAKHQRVSDHFTKQQRRNIEMWLKMTEEVGNIKEEFLATFEEDDNEKSGKNMIPLEKYEELKQEFENLTYELEGYKNEAHLAKDEAERKFEKFKAHFVAQQALQHNNQPVYPPLPAANASTPKPPPPADQKPSAPVPASEAKLISILTAFLMVHPLGVSIDYLTSYVKSMVSNVAQAQVQATLQKYPDVFHCKTTGVGASIDHKWTFATFDLIKSEA